MNAAKKAKGLAPKYTYRVSWSEEDQEFVGTCLEFPSLSGLAKSQAGALKEIAMVVEDSVQSILEDGAKPPEPIATQEYKGNLSLRTTPEKHRELALRAAESKVSINQYILSKIG